MTGCSELHRFAPPQNYPKRFKNLRLKIKNELYACHQASRVVLGRPAVSQEPVGCFGGRSWASSWERPGSSCNPLRCVRNVLRHESVMTRLGTVFERIEAS